MPIGLQFGLQLGSRVAPQRPPDSLGCVGHELRHYVRVHGHHADLLVTKHLHDHALVNALGEQEGGGGVPGVMNAYLADTSRLEQGLSSLPSRCESRSAAGSLRAGPGVACAITGAVGAMTTFTAGVWIGTAMVPRQTLELPADRQQPGL